MPVSSSLLYMRWIRGTSEAELAEEHNISIEQVERAIALAQSHFDFYKVNKNEYEYNNPDPQDYDDK